MLNKEFEFHIISSTKGFFPTDEIDKFFALIEIQQTKLHFTPSAIANLERIILSQFNLVRFIKEALLYEHHLEIVANIAANSNYLTDVVVKSPGLLSQLFVENYIQSKVSYNDLKTEVNSSISRFKSFSAKVNFFRRYKNRTLLKVGVADILGYYSLEETYSALSVLSKVITEALFAECLTVATEEKNIVRSELDDYVIVALGKLGGRELNYSSDIDLFFFYGKNRTFGDEGIEYYEILHSAIKLFVEKSSEITENGFIYRIDLRLRPDGKYSPLAKTMSDYVTYYETRGEDWERQMLLKMDFIAGNEKLFEKFKKAIFPFIYSEVSPSVYLNNVFRMKNEIEKEAGSGIDIKRCAGGIRDIEFSVQALQILFGKKYRGIKTGNTLEAIGCLREKNLLSNEEAASLKEAYVFYRKVEHFLQLRNDTQTHLIPQGEDLLRLANFLAFENVADFNSTLQRTLKKTRKIFLKIIGKVKINDESLTENPEINFLDKKRAEANLLFLKKGESVTGVKKFDTFTLKIASEVIPQVLSKLSNSQFPDLILENFRKIVESVKFPSIIFSEMKNEKFVELLLNSALFSDRFVADLINHSEFMDDFLSRVAFEKEIKEGINFTKFIYYLNLQFSHGIITAKEFSSKLQEFFNLNIKKKFQEIENYDKLFIASAGSLGSSELNFASDLDLLIIAENESFTNEKSIVLFVNELKQQFVNVDLDLRLRPEGKSSRLVWGISSYIKYLENRASLWEFLALTKLNFIAGNKSLFDSFIKGVVNNLTRFSKTEIKNEAQKMYRKILSDKGKFLTSNIIDLKKTHGYLKTIDFIVTTALVSNPKYFREMIGKPTSWKLDFLSVKNIVAEELKEAFTFDYALLLRTQSVFNNQRSTIPPKKELLERLIFVIDEPELTRKLLDVKKIGLNSYSKMFN